MRFLQMWSADTNPHIRRLVSEATRLRLPWAPRVAWLDQNPKRVLALLDLLKDDESTMVRPSMANNLNDLGNVRPDLLIRTAGAWLENESPERRILVEHALRSAVTRTRSVYSGTHRRRVYPSRQWFSRRGRCGLAVGWR